MDRSWGLLRAWWNPSLAVLGYLEPYWRPPWVTWSHLFNSPEPQKAAARCSWRPPETSIPISRPPSRPQQAPQRPRAHVLHDNPVDIIVVVVVVVRRRRGPTLRLTSGTFALDIIVVVAVAVVVAVVVVVVVVVVQDRVCNRP